MGKKIDKIHQDIEEKKFKELKKRGEDFLAAYKEVSTKYMIDFHAELDITPSGVKPVLKLRERAPELEIKPEKPWSECKRENLEKRKTCHHTLTIPNAEIEKAAGDEEKVRQLEENSPCATCQLAVKNWKTKEVTEEENKDLTIDGEGCTDEYVRNQEERITEEQDKERQAAKQEKPADDTK